MRLKICDSHVTCKVANKCMNVRERVEVVEWNKRWSPPFPCCPCESLVSVKENPDRKKKRKKIIKTIMTVLKFCNFTSFFKQKLCA